MQAPTLYDDAVAAGIQLDNHESDLYLLDGAPTRALLERHGRLEIHPSPRHAPGGALLIGPTGSKLGVSIFRSNLDGLAWWDVPFAFSPWWRKAEFERE